ncbi:hypothetical protein AAF712_016729 [Marasmius tenuissimus]|uniref:Myb-like domain-containing protein n=1 Tax=Marasmius tenuissimus TaxID=585030 RepID=A0ABR2Z6R2_9AGAR
MSSHNYNFFANTSHEDDENTEYTRNGSTNSSAGENRSFNNFIPSASPATPGQHVPQYQFGSLDTPLGPQGYFPPPGLPPLRQQSFYQNVDTHRRSEGQSGTQFTAPSALPPRPRPTRLPSPLPGANRLTPNLPVPRPLTPDHILNDQLPVAFNPSANTSTGKRERAAVSDTEETPQQTTKKVKKKAPAKSAKPSVRPAEKVEEKTGAKKGGRTKEATAYGNEEMRRLVQLFSKLVPIGRRGWEEVLCLYNEWAKRNGFPERQLRPLQTKWNHMVRVATEHPTGDGERLQIYEDVLTADSAANERVACGDLQDEDSGDEDGDVIEVSSDDDEVVVKKEKGKEKQKKKEDKGMAVTKAYRTEPPLPSTDNSLSRTSRTRQATAVLQNLAAASDPGRQQQLQEQRTQSTLQILQFQHLQTQVTSLQNRIRDLESQLQQAQMQTMAAQSEAQTLRLVARIQGHGSFDSPRSGRSPLRYNYEHRCQHRSRHERLLSPDYGRYYESCSPIRHHRSPVSSRRAYSPLPPLHTHSPPSPSHVPMSPPPLHSSPAPPAMSPVPLREETSIASGSRVTLDVLANVAGHLDAGHSYSIRAHPDGDLNIELSPSKKSM